MNSFRFLHAADIHLDSPLRGMSGQEGTAAELIRTATRAALDRLVGVAIEERVDFLIIPGDLYDGDWRDYKTGLFFVAQMVRIPLIMNASSGMVNTDSGYGEHSPERSDD